MRPIIADKFVAYGGTNEHIDTEFRGIVRLIRGDVIFVTPDPNYFYLAIDGNIINPIGASVDDDLRSLFGKQPIIKLETYRVGDRPDSKYGVGGIPLVAVDGRTRELRDDDHIVVTGLYVIDYTHPPYSSYYDGPFAYWRGIYRVGRAQAELHPYNYFNVQLIDQLTPMERVSEYHSVRAPIYPNVYTWTHLANKITRFPWQVSPLAGTLLEDTKRDIVKSVFELRALDDKSNDHVPMLVQSDVIQRGSGSVTVESQRIGPAHLRVTLTAKGTNVSDPVIHIAKYSVGWIPESSNPRCLEIVSSITQTKVALEEATNRYERWIAMAKQPGFYPDAAFRQRRNALFNQLTNIGHQLAVLEEEATNLDCPT